MAWDYDWITEEIIGKAFKVSNTLGAGFLEKVYENALAIELRKSGFSVNQQYPIHVHYQGEIVGEYFADLYVEKTVIIELKTVKTLDDIHLAQVLNYLKGTRNSIALLINFGAPKVQIKRVINNVL
ncbi:GxxExxY protein [Cecembia rubra]|uniref:GxxExxY protein n=1 Tax=Cecembia rubra TaxID=1485585 RepID=A0A2P8DTC7_9BACT|nr:GxxExxY protein [Cecembia rubra]PSL00476.1 GxxExxY protein [Cecembia rubra]